MENNTAPLVTTADMVSLPEQDYLRRAADLIDAGRPDGALWHAQQAALIADDLMHRAVAAMRTGGASWQDVADQLGMTKQSAWQRFSASA